MILFKTNCANSIEDVAITEIKWYSKPNIFWNCILIKIIYSCMPFTNFKTTCQLLLLCLCNSYIIWIEFFAFITCNDILKLKYPAYCFLQHSSCIIIIFFLTECLFQEVQLLEQKTKLLLLIILHQYTCITTLNLLKAPIVYQLTGDLYSWWQHL